MKRIVIVALMAVAGSIGIYELVTQVNKATAGIVRKDANQLVLALVRHDASLAPDGGEDWVPGVWSVFRRVDSATVARVGKRPQNGPNFGSSGSEWVADILLHTGRGLVLLELAFRSPSFSDGDQKVDLLYELAPARIPSGLLDAATLARLDSDQRERGPKLADDLVITLAGRTDRPARPTPPASTTPQTTLPHPVLPPLIRCIQRVRPNVHKIQQCVQRYQS
jgi:hypothetical protein